MMTNMPMFTFEIYAKLSKSQSGWKFVATI